MTILELKQILLQSNWFEENEYLEKYLKLIADNLNTPRIKYETQTHHAIPRCFYKQLNKELNEQHDVDKENILIELKHSDHLLAHYYLSLSVKDHLQITYLIDNALHIVYNTGDKCLLRNHSTILSEDFWIEFKSKLSLIDDIKKRYAEGVAFNSRAENMSVERRAKLKHTEEWKKHHSECIKGKPTYERTEEIKKKISDTLKKGYTENKYKISEEGKKRKIHEGAANGRYGKHIIWIYKDGMQKGVFSEKDIPEGWSRHKIRKVLQFDLDGNYIKEYDNVKEAADSLGLKGTDMIRLVCKGVYKQTKGYVFKWKNDGENNY